MSAFVEGVRDLLPAEIRERKRVYQELREVFARGGYQEVATPTLESLDLYIGAEGYFLQEKTFKVVDEKGQILVLRPDVTLPITRLAATRYSKTPRPWKFSYITTAYQNDGESHEMKEKTQAGVELFGRGDLLADAEVIGLLIESLQKVGLSEPQIDLGQAALVEEIFRELNLDSAQKAELRTLMEEKNAEEIRARLSRWELSPEEMEILLTLPVLFGEAQTVFAGMSRLPFSARARAIIAEMEELYRQLEQIGYARFVTYDPLMVTQLGYYTGTIFRAYVKGYGKVVANGGRYDGLARQFGLDVPAVGFAIEIERLLACLREMPRSQNERPQSLVLQVVEDDGFASSYQLANLLRARGLVVELYVGADVREYCRFHKIPYVGKWRDGHLLLAMAGGQIEKESGTVVNLPTRTVTSMADLNSTVQLPVQLDVKKQLARIEGEKASILADGCRASLEQVSGGLGEKKLNCKICETEDIGDSFESIFPLRQIKLTGALTVIATAVAAYCKGGGN